ncbi:hypothetical protein C5N14_09510 [Micromonospora sp. MW-13]|nr:hypothetical protein C5N14_09510 [Micromonospora sp. MW-13]
MTGYGGYPPGLPCGFGGGNARQDLAAVRHADAAHPVPGHAACAHRGGGPAQRCGSTLTRASSASR